MKKPKFIIEVSPDANTKFRNFAANSKLMAGKQQLSRKTAVQMLLEKITLSEISIILGRQEISV